MEWEPHANRVLTTLSSEGLFDAGMLSKMQSLVNIQRHSAQTG